MIRYTSLILLSLLLLAKVSRSQENLFDCDHSKRFASYLFNTGQYELSQHELERLLFFCDPDSASQLLLLKSYRKLKKFNKENVYFIGKSVKELQTLSPDFRLEYIRLQMAQKNYSRVQNLAQEGFDFKQKQAHLLGASLLQKDWQMAYELSQQDFTNAGFKMKGLAQIADKSYHQKRKKPWIATALSVVLPGSGKAYSGYWGDAAISFLFTASTSFFAYRAFEKYGTNNVYPWLIGGLAVSYYSANIYGGNRAAVHYNDNLDHEIIHETESILYSDY